MTASLFLRRFKPDSRRTDRSYDTVQARELSRVGYLARYRHHPVVSESMEAGVLCPRGKVRYYHTLSREHGLESIRSECRYTTLGRHQLCRSV